VAVLTVVVGLPGSGKSHYINRLIESHVVQKERTCGDYFLNCRDNILEVTRSPFFEPMINYLRRDLDCTVADISFCECYILKMFRAIVLSVIPTVIIREIYFANSPLACRRNLRHSPNEHNRLQEINRLSEHYAVPPGCTAIEVFQG
jgi:GTPase SAR1 family protein